MLSTTLRYFFLVIIATLVQLGVAVGYGKLGLISLPVRAGVAPAQLRRSINKREEDVYSSLSRNLTTLQYYIQLFLGNPLQPVEVLLGTDYNEFWVNPNCSNTDEPSECEKRGAYNPTRSSTSHNTHNESLVNYLDGSWANFTYCTDQVTLKSGQGPSDVRFGVATDSINFTSGILGVGVGAASNNGGEPNFIDQLAKQKLTNSKAFSLALGNGGADDQGAIIFGGVDTKKFSGKLIPNDIVLPEGSQTYTRYNIQMTSLGLMSSDGTLSSYGNSANSVLSIDAGTPFTYVPDTLIPRIYNDLQATDYSEIGYILAPCAQRQNSSQLQFAFGNATINVPSSELLPTSYDSTLCHVGILPQSILSAGVLGLSFLRSAYVVFDQTRFKISMQQYVNCGTNEQVILGSGVDSFIGECAATPSGNTSTASPTTGSTPTGSPTTEPTTSDLSTGAKAGVGVGVTVGALFIISLLYIIVRSRYHRATGRGVLQSPGVQDVGHHSPAPQYSPQDFAHNPASGGSGGAYSQITLNTPMVEAPASPQFPISRESAQYWASVNKQTTPPAEVAAVNTEVAELQAQHSPTEVRESPLPTAVSSPESEAHNGH
ncbi:aspartic peptidase domain-containing protein [Ustulina deusta]|nr:aspartic peptidase domain-containing protein [Ustulina deusta]